MHARFFLTSPEEDGALTPIGDLEVSELPRYSEEASFLKGSFEWDIDSYRYRYKYLIPSVSVCPFKSMLK